MIYFWPLRRAAFPKLVPLLAVSEKPPLPFRCFPKRLGGARSFFPSSLVGSRPHLVTVYNKVSVAQGDGGRTRLIRGS